MVFKGIISPPYPGPFGHAKNLDFLETLAKKDQEKRRHFLDRSGDKDVNDVPFFRYASGLDVLSNSHKTNTAQPFFNNIPGLSHSRRTNSNSQKLCKENRGVPTEKEVIGCINCGRLSFSYRSLNL
jgi:hypothetical protein